MGKSMTREERKNNKYLDREADRRRKDEQNYLFDSAPPNPKPKKKYRPKRNDD